MSNDGRIVLTASGTWTESSGYVPLAAPAGSANVDMSADGRFVLLLEAASTPGSIGRALVVDRVGGTSVELAGPGFFTCLSGDGSTVGGSTANASGVSEATVWDATTGSRTVIDPGTVFDSGAVRALSFDGAWATGGLVQGGFGIRAFRWSAATGFEAFPPSGSPGGLSGDGIWISSDGSSLITRFTPPGFTFDFDSEYWVEGVGPSPMAQWLLSQGVPELPFNNEHGVWDASADGRTLALVTLQADFSARIDLDARVSESYCGPAVPNSTGSGAELRVLGSDAAGGQVLRLRATGLPPAQFLLAAASRTADSLPGVGGSAGTLCLGGAVGRFQVGQSNGAGLYELDLDSSALPQPNGTVAATAGDTWHIQVWYRDAGGSNLTDGARLTFH